MTYATFLAARLGEFISERETAIDREGELTRGDIPTLYLSLARSTVPTLLPLPARSPTHERGVLLLFFERPNGSQAGSSKLVCRTIFSNPPPRPMSVFEPIGVWYFSIG